MVSVFQAHKCSEESKANLVFPGQPLWYETPLAKKHRYFSLKAHCPPLSLCSLLRCRFKRLLGSLQASEVWMRFALVPMTHRTLFQPFLGTLALTDSNDGGAGVTLSMKICHFPKMAFLMPVYKNKTKQNCVCISDCTAQELADRLKMSRRQATDNTVRPITLSEDWVQSSASLKRS